MGTSYTVKVVDPPDSINQETLGAEIQRELDAVDALMSTYRDDSELSRLNTAAAGEWIAVSEETVAVVESALEIGKLTDGAFDVTVGPLVNLWNFGPKKDKDTEPTMPSDDQIDATMQIVGLDLIELRHDPPTIRKGHEDLYIDLSGIAKGYAADRVAAHLESCGIENYMVEVGGELRAKGQNLQGKPWQIAVEAPVAGVRARQRVVGLNNTGMATSGDYRNFFEHEGVRYAHIIDPRTGRPVRHRLASVTVLDPSCQRADALATALMVLGPKAGYELAVKEDLAVLLIERTDDGFSEKATPRFEETAP